MRKEYASELTKEELIKAGVVAVDLNNCRVYGVQSELSPTINAQGYFMINICEVDEDGNKIKLPYKRQYKGCKHITNTYRYKTKTISLNRLLWAWKYGKVKAGYVIDHINNKHENLEDYKLDNLQEITPAQNLTKEKEISTYMLRPAKRKSIEYYEEKLYKYLKEYEEAKKAHQAERAHKLRSNISQQKAKIIWIQKHGIEF